MEKSTLYDILSKGVISDWREKTEKEGLTYDNGKVAAAETALLHDTPTINKELLSNYSLAIKNRMDYLFYNVGIQTFNLGVQIGMELHKSFFAIDDE